MEQEIIKYFDSYTRYLSETDFVYEIYPSELKKIIDRIIKLKIMDEVRKEGCYRYTLTNCDLCKRDISYIEKTK